MSTTRLQLLFIVLVFVVLVAAGSWFVGSKIQSPSEVAARTAPPAPSPILVPVEKRTLSSNIVTRGTSRFGLPQAISIVPSTLKPGPGVIATLPSRGAKLSEGDVALTASGRPVLVLKGEIPTFRDLVPGLSGEDVRQLESALKRLGFAPGAVDGKYDQKTGAAVGQWYRSKGWKPFGPTAGQTAKVRNLEQELAVAVNEALVAGAAVTAAPLVEQAAQAKDKHENAQSAIEVAAKRAARDQVRANPNSTDAARARAEAELAAALALKEAKRLAGAVELHNSAVATRAAERKLALATSAEVKLKADLEAAKGELGTQVPADEIVFMPELPVRVDHIDAAVGVSATGPVLKVTDHQLAIDASLRLDEAPLVKSGMPVKIDEPDLGIKATGIVNRVASRPGTDGVDGYHIYFETLVDKTDTALEGISLRLTITVKTSRGAVTTVPTSALTLAGDGSTRVQVVKGGVTRFVVVEPGLSANGYVEVSALDGELAPGQMVVVGYE